MAPGPVKSRQDAWDAFTELTKSESLVKHGLAVEAVMRAFARKHGAEEETWGMVGMLHDFDYEQYPDRHDHGTVGGRILAEKGFPEEVIHAVMSHNEATGVPRVHLLDKVLFAVDELVGLITATALVRPTKSVYDVDAGAVRRKMKDKAFARSVSREDILKGIQDLEVDMDQHIAFVIQAMQGVAAEIGLEGTGTPSGQG